MSEYKPAVAIVYTNLYVKLHKASREENHDRYEEVMKLMDALEEEFPTEVMAERAGWDLPVVVYDNGERK